MWGLVLGVMLSFQQEELELPAPYSDVHVELRADVWFASFSGGGHLNHWFGNERDQEKDAPSFLFHREGRLADPAPAPGGQLHVLWENGRNDVRGFGIQFRRGEWSESGTIDQSFVVDGTTVPAGSSFRSRMQKYTASAFAVAGRRLSDLPLEARGWVGCFFHQERFRMQTASGDLKDGGGGLNLCTGGRVEIRPLPFVFAAGEVSGALGWGLPEAQAAVSAGVTWSRFQLEGGYRHLWSGGFGDPIFHMSVGGPFVGGSIRF